MFSLAVQASALGFPGFEGERMTRPATLHVLGPTLMPHGMVPRAYRRLTGRLRDRNGTVTYHGMPERGGLGRTDRIVDGFRPLLARARADGGRVRLAGHSLGGVVCWALAHEYADVVERVELWCAPVRGTRLASARAPVAESRFLCRESRWLASYDRPLTGVRLRAVFPAKDALASPAVDVCPVEGDDCENHLVHRPGAAPRGVAGMTLHAGSGGHVTLPARAWIHGRLRVVDASRRARSAAEARPPAAA
jgi:pimeloyl-ACP methyl ester carboxylesterase